jgi:hypothetical protein
VNASSSLLVRCALLALLLLAAGCITTETVRPARPDANLVRRALRAQFEARLDGRVVGLVNEYGGAQASDRYWSVMNAWGQEVGFVDDLMRYWRHVPHEELPRHVGAGPLVEGVVRLLELDGEPQLVAVESRD